jgi:hypothetical protein
MYTVHDRQKDIKDVPVSACVLVYMHKVLHVDRLRFYAELPPWSRVCDKLIVTPVVRSSQIYGIQS